MEGELKVFLCKNSINVNNILQDFIIIIVVIIIIIIIIIIRESAREATLLVSVSTLKTSQIT